MRGKSKVMDPGRRAGAYFDVLRFGWAGGEAAARIASAKAAGSVAGVVTGGGATSAARSRAAQSSVPESAQGSAAASALACAPSVLMLATAAAQAESERTSLGAAGTLFSFG